MAWHPGKKALIGLVLVALAFVALQLALDPIATHYTRRALEEHKTYRGSFRDVEVTLIPLTYTVENLALYRKPVREDEEPYLRVARAKLDISWSQLVRGDLVMDVRLEHPKMTVVAGRTEEKEAKRHTEEVAERPKEQKTTVRIDELTVKKGELTYVAAKLPDNPELWVHDITLKVTHYSPEGPPDSKTNLVASGIVQRSGRLGLEVEAYPLAKRATFTARASLERLRIAELYQFLAEPAGVAPVKGTMDMYALIEAKDGKLRGGVKPLIQNAEVEAVRPGLGNQLKELLADATVEIFGNDNKGDEIATTIPITGDVQAPGTQVWPTVLGALRNAFVEGLVRGFSELPVPQARDEENPFSQLREALSPGGTVKAQPPKDGDGEQRKN
jgi:hypothetical protein